MIGQYLQSSERLKKTHTNIISFKERSHPLLSTCTLQQRQSLLPTCSCQNNIEEFVTNRAICQKSEFLLKLVDLKSYKEER
jgi:hypothetical protein